MWIWQLLTNHIDDFWLNIIAGVPFLLFDVVIITVLLPTAIEWWDRRRWHDTRVAALKMLLDDYDQKSNTIWQDCSRLATYGDGSLRIDSQVLDEQRLDNWLQETRARWTHLQHDMESNIQTALAVLDSDQTRDALELHTGWKAAIGCALRMLSLFESYFFKPPTDATPHQLWNSWQWEMPPPREHGDEFVQTLAHLSLSKRRIKLRYLNQDHKVEFSGGTHLGLIDPYHIYYLEYALVVAYSLRFRSRFKPEDYLETLKAYVPERQRIHGQYLLNAAPILPAQDDTVLGRLLRRRRIPVWTDGNGKPATEADLDRDLIRH